MFAKQQGVLPVVERGRSGDGLDRNRAGEHAVMALVHRTETAAADPFDSFVSIRHHEFGTACSQWVAVLIAHGWYARLECPGGL